MKPTTILSIIVSCLFTYPVFSKPEVDPSKSYAKYVVGVPVPNEIPECSPLEACTRQECIVTIPKQLNTSVARATCFKISKDGVFQYYEIVVAADEEGKGAFNLRVKDL